MENGKQSSDAKRCADLQSSSRPEASKSHLALLHPGEHRGPFEQSVGVGCLCGPGQGRGGGWGARCFFPSLLRVSPLCAGPRSRAARVPRSPSSPGELTSSRTAPSPPPPWQGPAPASRGCPAATASQPGLPLAPSPCLLDPRAGAGSNSSWKKAEIETLELRGSGFSQLPLKARPRFS